MTVAGMDQIGAAMDMQFMPERRGREIFVATGRLKSKHRRCDIILGAIYFAPHGAWHEAAHYYKDAAPTALLKGRRALSRPLQQARRFAGSR